jgi:hypothetical protein
LAEEATHSLSLGANEEGNRCLAVKRNLQRLREKTLKENQSAWRLRWQPHHQDRVLWANNPHTLNPAIKEIDVKRNC